MALLWHERRNLENSFVDFLSNQASGLTVFHKGEEKSLDIRVGRSPREDWNLPVISFYLDNRLAPRSFVGNNKRIKTYLAIIDIRALDDGMRQDLADWIGDIINDGFDFYNYSPDSTNPDITNTVADGKVSVDFVTDTVITTGENVDIFDKYRHNISVNLQIN